MAAARRLEKLAEAQINDLAMKARFAMEVTAEEEAQAAWTEHGWDSVACRIATNAGEPMKPLEEIASGGELSRVLLALKVSVEEGAAGKSRKKTALPRTLVFDEIDIGIGGRAAEAVGQKLRALAEGQQGCASRTCRRSRRLRNSISPSRRRSGRADADAGAADERRGADGRGGADAERGEGDGGQPEARGADDSGGAGKALKCWRKKSLRAGAEGRKGLDWRGFSGILEG